MNDNIEFAQNWKIISQENHGVILDVISLDTSGLSFIAAFEDAKITANSR